MLRRTTSLLLALLIEIMAVTPLGAAAAERPPVATTPVFVDTDPGVDDAVAIAWLLRSQTVNVVGFTTVAGNTSVENGTQNLLTLLDAAGRSSIPVTVGAAAGLAFPASGVSGFVHGPDGFWFAQKPHDLSRLSHNAPAAIAAAARANPGLTLVALGPLTNIAQAARRYPAEMAGVHIIALAGAIHGGNRTPVAETNAFIDPQALQIVLDSHLDVTLVTLDSFTQVTFDSAEFPQELAAEGGPLGQLLAGILNPYMASETKGVPGKVSVPDVAAVALALRPTFAQTTSGLAAVMTDGGLTRGQTIIATDPNFKIMMIADDAELTKLVWDFFHTPNFDVGMAMGTILMRRPDNAKVVTSIDGKGIARALVRDLTR